MVPSIQQVIQVVYRCIQVNYFLFRKGIQVVYRVYQGLKQIHFELNRYNRYKGVTDTAAIQVHGLAGANRYNRYRYT